MERPEIEREVLEVLGEVVPGAGEKELDRTVLLRDQLDIDSMDFLNFVLALETRFSIEVPPTSYPLFASPRGAVDGVAELLGPDAE